MGKRSWRRVAKARCRRRQVGTAPSSALKRVLACARRSRLAASGATPERGPAGFAASELFDAGGRQAAVAGVVYGACPGTASSRTLFFPVQGVLPLLRRVPHPEALVGPEIPVGRKDQPPRGAR
jgi:hypothetical protein